MSFSRLWRSAKPLIGNGLVVSGMFAAADLTQQTIEKKKTYDYVSTRRMMLVGGVLMGPFTYTWHKNIEALLPGYSPRTVLVKVVVTLAVAGAILNAIFFGATAYLNGDENVWEEVKTKWPKAYKTAWLYWPVINVANFMLVPVHLRGLVANFFGYVWTTILCIFKQQGHEKLPEGIDSR